MVNGYNAKDKCKIEANLVKKLTLFSNVSVLKSLMPSVDYKIKEIACTQAFSVLASILLVYI